MICYDESFSANKNDRSVLIVNLFLTKWNIAIEILEDEEGTIVLSTNICWEGTGMK